MPAHRQSGLEKTAESESSSGSLSGQVLKRLKADSVVQEKKKRRIRPLGVVISVAMMAAVAGVVAPLFLSPPIDDVGSPLDVGVSSALPAKPRNTISTAVRAVAQWVPPKAVVAVDIGAVADRDLMSDLPRLRAWCHRYLKLDLNEIACVVAVGRSASEYAFGFVLRWPVDAESRNRAEGDLRFETMRGPWAARMMGSKLIVAAPVEVMGQPSPSGNRPAEALPESLAAFLATAPGSLSTYLDLSEDAGGTLPFFVSDPSVDLQRKVVRLTLGETTASLLVRADYPSSEAARRYVDRYSHAMRLSLQKLIGDQASLVDSSIDDMRFLVEESGGAKIRWNLGDRSEALVSALIEMAGDAIGAEAAPLPTAHLKKEAQRIAALYQTAVTAGAPLSEVADVQDALSHLIRGVRAVKSEWNQRLSQTRPYTPKERQVLADHLVLEEGQLRYQENALAKAVEEASDPKLGDGRSETLKIKYRRDAAALATALNGAMADEIERVPGVHDVDQAIALMADREGVLSGNVWQKDRVAPLSQQDLDSLKYFLRLEDGQLVVAEAEVE